GEDGYLNITGSFLNRETTNRTGEHDLHVYTPGFAYPLDDNPEQARQEDNEIIRGNGKTRDESKFHIGDAGIQLAAAFSHAGGPVEEQGTEGYAFGGLSNRPGTGYPFRRLSVDGGNVTAIYPDGFQPVTRSSITDKSLAVGMRGKLKGWNIDFSN